MEFLNSFNNFIWASIFIFSFASAWALDNIDPSTSSYLNSLIKHDTHLQNLLNLNDIIEDIGIIKSFIEEEY